MPKKDAVVTSLSGTTRSRSTDDFSPHQELRANDARPARDFLPAVTIAKTGENFRPLGDAVARAADVPVRPESGAHSAKVHDTFTWTLALNRTNHLAKCNSSAARTTSGSSGDWLPRHVHRQQIQHGAVVEIRRMNQFVPRQRLTESLQTCDERRLTKSSRSLGAMFTRSRRLRRRHQLLVKRFEEQ